jgi:uncharacterized Zn ribbon protein
VVGIMEVKDVVKKIKEISPRVKDIKLTRLQHEIDGNIEGVSWVQIEESGRWKVEFIIEKE